MSAAVRTISCGIRRLRTGYGNRNGEQRSRAALFGRPSAERLVIRSSHSARTGLRENPRTIDPYCIDHTPGQGEDSARRHDQRNRRDRRDRRGAVGRRGPPGRRTATAEKRVVAVPGRVPGQLLLRHGRRHRRAVHVVQNHHRPDRGHGRGKVFALLSRDLQHKYGNPRGRVLEYGETSLDGRFFFFGGGGGARRYGDKKYTSVSPFKNWTPPNSGHRFCDRERSISRGFIV